MRALLFWPYRLQPKPLWTSTGYFDLLIGTTVTAIEWQMARDTSSTHLVYLLSRAGIGQVSDLVRTTVTDDPQWLKEWEAIRGLPNDGIEGLLAEE